MSSEIRYGFLDVIRSAKYLRKDVVSDSIFTSFTYNHTRITEKRHHYSVRISQLLSCDAWSSITASERPDISASHPLAMLFWYTAASRWS